MKLKRKKTLVFNQNFLIDIRNINMPYVISKIQKEKYKDFSGLDYVGSENRGSFQTLYPHNDHNWKSSPFNFSFIFEQETGNLICELDHRMTNNEIRGWDQEGNDLSEKTTGKYFLPHF